MAGRSARSAPTQSARSPAPVTMATSAASSVAKCRHTAGSSRLITELIALCACGRSSVISATPSVSSYFSVLNSIAYSRLRMLTAQPVG